MTETLPAKPRNPIIDQAIVVWLNAKVGRSNSRETKRKYEETIWKFREALFSAGADLDSEIALIRLAAQGWAGQRQNGDIGDGVANATYNLRIAIISSFYEYAIKHELIAIAHNPLEIIERRPVQAYAGARPLDPDELAAKLKAIPRRTKSGARDYALLSVALNTGRRASELAGLRVGHLKLLNGGKKIEVTWVRCKGGKVMYDTLEGTIAKSLTAYLTLVYGSIAAIERLPADSPVWIAYSRNQSKGGAIGTQTIADIFEKRIGTSKIHATRHTFAHEMEKAGARVSEIGERLGHSSLAVTTRYLGSVGDQANPYSERLAQKFGITDPDEEP